MSSHDQGRRLKWRRTTTLSALFALVCALVLSTCSSSGSDDSNKNTNTAAGAGAAKPASNAPT